MDTTVENSVFEELVESSNLFVLSYIEAALWTSSDDRDVPLDHNYDGRDLSEEALKQIISECEKFQAENADLLEQAGSEEQNGHDFWLTRNGHGVGFWDRGYDDTVGKALTVAAEKRPFGSQTLYVDDDGVIQVL